MFLSKVQFFLYVICLFDICLHLLEINVSQWNYLPYVSLKALTQYDVLPYPSCVELIDKDSNICRAGFQSE